MGRCCVDGCLSVRLSFPCLKPPCSAGMRGIGPDCSLCFMPTQPGALALVSPPHFHSIPHGVSGSTLVTQPPILALLEPHHMRLLLAPPHTSTGPVPSLSTLLQLKDIPHHAGHLVWVQPRAPLWPLSPEAPSSPPRGSQHAVHADPQP